MAINRWTQGLVGGGLLAALVWGMGLVPGGREPPAAAEGRGGSCTAWEWAGPCTARRRKGWVLGVPDLLRSNRGPFDDRVELHCLADPGSGELPAWAKAAPTIFTEDRLEAVAGGWRVKPSVGTLASLPGTPLCPDEAFVRQPRGARCTAALVASRTIVTSRRCLAEDLSRVRVGFAYRVSAADPEAEIVMAAPSLCGITGTPERVGESLVLLDLECEGAIDAEALTLGATPGPGDAVHMVGYPMGLPAKFAAGAKVLGQPGEFFFHADLDVFRGNSGSPVFNARDEVVGIVIEDESKHLCPDASSRGQACWRWNSIASTSPREVTIATLREVKEALARRERARRAPGAQEDEP